ncbi:MAG: cytochrome c oxidase subunit I [Thermomicrobiales bacterium]|nr:cytochrome c oxidase subunit I [Thermomicrobiales bacterium]MCO5229347.1 cytochrome c oxidase subunit I [Thermomicrobiales bacterium]
MASIAQPGVSASVPSARPVTKQRSGLLDWITTVDHKKIGIMYGVTAIFFLMIGGLEALLIRTQLITSGNGLINEKTYNELFTMHGTTMIFLGVMPLTVAFWNYIMPLQIGARDVAMPRLNAFSYWLFLAAGLTLNISWFFGEAPNQGWYAYAPLTDLAWNPSRAVDFWIVGLTISGISSMLGAFNFIVTILNMRAPGMSLMRMPVFTWTTLITSILLIMAFPAITVAIIFLMFDRWIGTNFYVVAAGGDPLLWQHLFWIFGHPEVYIMILPVFGAVSEIVPTFSRKPLFGYSIMVYATCAIAFLGFGVWAHHMFTTGMGPTANAVFGATTMTIAIPTGVKIFNWLGTMALGQVRFTVPMMFTVGMISMFTIGGISGVMHATVPIDGQHNDSYFLIAHFHYVLFGGSLFGLIGALYFWFPKVAGRMMDEGIGRWNFWATFVGFNMTFFPMHFLGLEGMPRRYYTYGEGAGWNFWNAIVTFGAYILGAAMLLLLFNIGHSLKAGKRVGANPWDAPTLEWATTSPPPVYNFAEQPIVASRDPLWAEKYGHSSDTPAFIESEEIVLGPNAGDDVHLPNSSFWPLVSATGMFVMGLGFLFSNLTLFYLGPLAISAVSVVGLLTLIWGIFAWAFEPTGVEGLH